MDLLNEYLNWAATQSVNSGSGTMDECRERNDSLRFCEVDPEEIAEDFDEDLT